MTAPPDDARSAAATSDAAPRRPPLWRSWVKAALGIALLVWVLTRVGWQDSVVLVDGTVVTGEIVGDVPRGAAPDDEVRLLVDGRETPYRIRDLAAEDVGGERFAKIHEGLLRLVRKSDPWLLLAALAMFGAIAQIGVWRWLLLLRAQSIRLTFGLAHRLTFIGFFFNNVVPGPTGGDVVKAVYVARGAARRAPAVVTVIVDRVLGLVALALIALFALLTQLDEPHYRELSVFVFGFLAFLVVAGVVFFSRRIRRAVGLDAILARLPMGGLLRKADEAMFAWRDHKGALGVGLGLSFANQMAVQLMMWTVAAGLHVTTRTGGEVGAVDYMIVLPVAFIASSLPVLPGGWGLRETAFAVCFHFIGVDRNPAVALSVTCGMIQLAWSLLGGVYFLLGRAAGEFRGEPGAAFAEGDRGAASGPGAGTGPGAPPAA